MKVGVYGGSYNPIHIGHTSLAQSLVAQGLVDEVWFLVSPLNPLKQDATNEIAAYHHRIRMAQLATEGMPGVRVSDFESHLPIPSYMFDTLTALCHSYPDKEFCLIIGADNWLAFDRWYRYADILRRFPILVYPRPGYEIEDDTLPSGVTLVNTPLYDVSSTQIRTAVRTGAPTDNLIAASVATYISENKLYSL